jgi:hypothetical protein
MEQVSYIHVDSRNRDTALFPFSNTYTVFLNTPITNVTRVDLVTAIVSNPFSTGNAYIWLDITELRTPSTYDARKLTLTNVGPLASPIVPIATISSLVSSTTLAGQANQVYTNIASTATGNGTGARFTVSRNGTGVPAVTLVTGGNGYSVGNTITLAGATVGGATPADNITFTVATIGTNQIQRNQTSSQTPATSFAVIPLDVPVNFQRTFKEASDYAWSVTYPSRLDSIERLTVRWLDNSGAIVNFGNAAAYDPNMFVLRVYTQIVPTAPERPLSLPPPVREGLFEDKSKVYLGAVGMLVIGLIMIMLVRKRR